MTAKKHILLSIMIPIFLLSLIVTIIPVQAPLPAPSVKVYPSQNAYPFVLRGGIFTIDFIIETNGIPDNSVQGIIGWGMLVQIDPSVLWPGMSICAMPGYFLYEWADWEWLPYPTTVYNINTTSGEISVSEIIMPPPSVGAGDAYSGLKLFSIRVQSLNDTRPCLINIVKGDYQKADGIWHNFDVMIDGQYGEPSATYVSNKDPSLDLMNPLGSTWHELWPNYCNTMTLTSWEDNGDQVLSASDQLYMWNLTDDWIYIWHVDSLTVTIHWTFKDGPFIGEPGEAEPAYTRDDLDYGGDPIGTGWHQIYPEFNRSFRIISWIDQAPENGIFDPSDQFDFVYEDDGTVYNAHLEEITIDIIISQKEEPWIPVAEFLLGPAFEILFIPAIIYIFWRSKQRKEYRA